MSRQVEWARQALKRVARADQPTRDNILTAIEDLAENNQGDVRRLAGSY